MTQADRREPSPSSQLLILISFTLVSVALIGETILMDWELWAIPLIVACIVICWILHIRSGLTGHQRMWVYTTLMMGVFFFYGIHVTSTYDMALLMMCMMIIYTTTGEEALVTLCQITYYVTLAYDVVAMLRTGTEWDSLLISRTALHAALVFLAAWLTRTIIRQWARLLHSTDERIEELDRSARHMTTFMEHLSHELRTPINAILGITDVMLTQEQEQSVRLEMQTVQAAGNLMKDQVSDILDYSEIETGKLVVNAEAFEPSSLLNDVVSELRQRIPVGLELVIDVDATIPASMVSDATMLRKIIYHLTTNSLRYTREGGVYLRLSCVSQAYGANLCIEVTDTGIGMAKQETSQATQQFYQADSGRDVRPGGLGLGLSIVSGFVSALGGFMVIESEPDAGTTVRVSVPVQVADPSRCLTVEQREHIYLATFIDLRKFSNPRVREFYNAMILSITQGLGIPIHRVDSLGDLKRLLDRVEVTHLFVGVEEYEATAGYLETLVQRMVVAVVAFDDYRLPEHSRATIASKPLYCFPVAQVLNSTPEDHAAERHISCPGIHALVVDDEPMNLVVASSILRRLDMNVSTAGSGEQAIRMCAEEPFDLVFMDHMMPGMDGIETMRIIRSQHDETQGRLPIIALTANALSTAREMFRAEGFDGFVSKPIESGELERVIRRVLPATSIEYKQDAASASKSKVQALPEAQTDAPTPPTDLLGQLEADGFDTSSALRYLQQDEDLYRDLLRQFVTDAPGKQDQLSASLAQDDCGGYAIVVHALKSTSLTIGATQLSELARALEEAAKAGQSSFLRQQHKDLLEHYTQTVTCIADALDEGGNTPALDEDVLEFLPEDDDVLEFAPTPDDDVLEFAPEPEEETLDLLSEVEDEFFEFVATPEEDVFEFEPIAEEGLQ